MTLTDPTAVPSKPRKPTGSKVLMILGAVLLVVAFIGGWKGAHRMQRAADNISRNADDVRAAFLADFAAPGHRAVELPRGRYTVYAVVTANAGYQTTTAPGSPPTDDTGDNEPKVTVTDPNGAVVLTSTPGLGSLFSGAGANFLALRAFTVVTPGTYRVEVGASRADRAAVGPAVGNGDVARALTGGLLALLAFELGGVGFVLGLAGFIWFLVADAKRKPPPGTHVPPGLPPPPVPAPAGPPSASPWGSGPPMGDRF